MQATKTQSGKAMETLAIARQTSNMTLGRGNERFVTLMFPFKLDEVEVPTRVAIGIVAADLWSPFINRAAPFTLVEKHAHRFVHSVVAMPQHAHLLTFVRHFLRKFVTRCVDR